MESEKPHGDAKPPQPKKRVLDINTMKPDDALRELLRLELKRDRVVGELDW